MKSKPHWTKKVPKEPGLYWLRPCPAKFGYPPYPAWTTGDEFTFIGTDSAASPKELRAEGVEFWSERLEAPK